MHLQRRSEFEVQMMICGIPTPNWRRVSWSCRSRYYRARGYALARARRAREFVSLGGLYADVLWHEYDYAAHDGGYPPETPACRVLWRLMHWRATATTIARIVYLKSDFGIGYEDGLAKRLAVTIFYRIKAIVCLLLGLHSRKDYDLELDTLIEWNWRKVSYEYDEWEPDRLDVGYGFFRNWRVHLCVRELLG
jgi:hypothetical protein